MSIEEPTNFEECVASVRAGLKDNTAFAKAVRYQATMGFKSQLLMDEAIKPVVVQAPQASDMPEPDALLDYGNGLLEAAMFHYCGEGSNYVEVAQSAGFVTTSYCLSDDFSPAGQQLQEQYEAGGDGMQIAVAWQPSVPEGWTLAAKFDTEDGLYVLFVKRP